MLIFFPISIFSEYYGAFTKRGLLCLSFPYKIMYESSTCSERSVQDYNKRYVYLVLIAENKRDHSGGFLFHFDVHFRMIHSNQLRRFSGMAELMDPIYFLTCPVSRKPFRTSK